MRGSVWNRFHLYRDINHKVRVAYQEISTSQEGKVQRQVIRRIATLTSRDDQQAQVLLEELSSSHHLNAELIALVRLFKSAWQHSTFHRAATHLQGFAQVAMRSRVLGQLKTSADALHAMRITSLMPLF